MAEFTEKARRSAAGRRQMRHGRSGLALTQGSARDPFWKRPLQSLQFELGQTCGPAVNCSRLRLPGPIHKFRESKKGLRSSKIKDRFFFCG
jgi:hypothetical protein